MGISFCGIILKVFGALKFSLIYIRLNHIFYKIGMHLKLHFTSVGLCLNLCLAPEIVFVLYVPFETMTATVNKYLSYSKLCYDFCS